MKKNVSKTLSLLMSVVMLVGMLSLPMAFAADLMQISLGNVTGAVGTQVVVPMNVSANSRICSSDFRVSFDNTKLEFVSGANGSVLTSVGASTSINPTPTVSGTTSTINTNFYYDFDAGLTQAGPLFLFTFTILPGLVESTTLDVDFPWGGEPQDTNFDSIPCETISGSVSLPAATPTYQITFDAGEGVGGGTQTVDEGEMPIVPADPTRVGFRFIDWDPAVVVATEDATYTAVWEEIIIVTMSFDSKGGSDVDPVSGEVGSAITYPANPSRTGYAFLNWDPMPENFRADVTSVSALWIANDHQITFDPNGGVGGGTQTVKYDVTPVPPVVTREGFNFVEWSPAVTYVTGDATYTAIWEEIVATTYEITFDAAGGLGGDVLTVEEGVLPVAPVVTREGYTFLGWDVEVAVATANATYTAQWELIPVTVYYEITFDMNGGEGGDVVLQVEEGVMPVVPTATYEGYTFLGWDVEVAVATANATYIAQWELIPVTVYYAITFDADGGVGGDVFTVEEGVVPTAPVVTKAGFDFVEWTPAIVAAAADATYTAVWEEIVIATSTISFNTDGGNAITPLTGEVGSAVPTVADPTKEGFTFIGWSSAIPTTFPEENVEVTAQWEINTYTITWDANGGDTGVDTNEFEHGSMPTPIDPGNWAGHTFVEWTPAVVAATEDTTYTAVWAINSYEITFDAAGGVGGQTLTVDYGETPVAPTVTKEGFIFVEWTPAIVAANADATYTAVWEEDLEVTYTITFDAAGGLGGTTDTVEEGAMPAIPTVTRAGYIFYDWDVQVQAAIADATYTALWYMLGDVNGDGQVTALDALMVLQASTGEITLTPMQALAADVNSDGRLSALDALMMLHFASGTLTEFPNMGV